MITVTTPVGRRKRDENEVVKRKFWDKNIKKISNVQDYIHDNLDFDAEYKLQVS